MVSLMLYLHGLGHFHPENEVDNAFLESLDIGTNERWIVERVGIRNRRTVLPARLHPHHEEQGSPCRARGCPLHERRDRAAGGAEGD
jgi:hypothetical protein